MLLSLYRRRTLTGAAMRDFHTQELATCLRGDARCRATRAQLRAMALQLQGVRMLVSTRPQCMLRNIRGGCASLHANAETGFSMVRPCSHMRKPSSGVHVGICVYDLCP